MDTDHGWRDKNDSESSDSRRSQYNRSESARGGRGGRRTRGSSSYQKPNKENLRDRPFDKKVAKYGIGYQKIENLCKDMDQGKVLSGSADLLTAVQAESFYNRLDDLWPDLEKQANLLRVIVATASTNQRDLLNLTHDFISKVFGSKLVHSIVGECICPMVYDSQMQENPIYARIANSIVKLLFLGYQLLPSTMDQHLSDVVCVISSLKAVKDECLKEETKNELERLEIALKARQEVKNAQRLTEDKRKQENKEFVGSIGEPPKNFREISVVPIPEDIKHEISPYLRPAKVKGRYQSDEQYLDILFRLLREDLIRPLRDGIASYRKGGTKETDLYVYRDVEIGKSFMHKKTGELLSTASINVLKRMRWDKRLKYGSLVCLSSDDFQESFLFATVLERDDLPNGKVGLKFEDVLKINTKLKYKMVESPAFFEAYRHVMTALQAIEEDEPIPFTNYLVDVETTTKPPLYSIDKRFDFKSLLKVDRQNTEFFLHEIRRLKPDDFGMDESQFNALLYTLTSELAIIQGPPGTGKTFMGLQIVKLLFDNWSIWNPDQRDCRPLLVVCYTNHALDQFLEGISEFIEDGIVRVGGRCKNDKVAQYNLSRARRWDNPTIRNQFYNKKEEIDFARKELQEASTTLKAVESRFASPLQLSRTFWDKEKRCSKNNFFGWDKRDTSMFKWLTQTDQIYPMTIYDINIIRQLMEWDIPEIQAKNILADVYERHYLPDAESLYYFLQGPGGDYYSDTEVSANAKLWPKTDDIDQVKLLGYSDNVAAELLVGMSVDEIREEHDRSNGTKATTSQQLYNVTAILEQLDISEQPPETDNKDEEIDELAFKDDDEENRRIIDTDAMEDFQERKDESEEVKEVDWFNAEILKDFLEHITSATPMTEEECDETEDIWALPLQKRWKLYQFWIKKCHEEVKERIEKLEEEYSEKMKLLVDFRSLADVDVLKSAKVVGMTTTGAAKLQSTLRALRPKIVIVEEAAEVLFEIPNRVCVALSRAKLGLYVICNMDFFAKNCELWNEIRNSAVKAGALKNELIVRCQKHQNEQVIQHYNDFGIKSREGGCHIPCNGRLECGHQCIKPCHVEDMDHTSQKCFKRCEKKCKSVFEHPCMKDCWKECGNCEIKVLKHLPCGHEKIDSCFLDASDVQCSKDCQKTLSCGHSCKEKCGSECTKFCEEIVKRKLPDCGHYISMKCGEKITSVRCKAAVTKKWPFCKHTVETFCSSNVTALPCPHPCNTVLSDCEHLCNGTCGKCRNGRLHIACSENCNKIFLCEHECDAKCSKVCPPCSKPCETECGHSQCGNQPIKGEQQKKTRKVINQPKGSKSGRRCGEPCPPCKEPCLNQCEHRKCTKKCGDPCNVKPCSEPCMKLLPCNPKLNVDDLTLVEHRCIGICGEECLKICKICDPEKFSEIQQIFFGTEDNENARFVQLKDCGHIFEVTGLDEWIESSLPKPDKKNDSIEIVQIKCPQCKTSIRRSKRYISILNERAIDIEQIKQKTRGFTNDEKKKEQSRFRGEVKQVFNAFKETDFGKTENVSKLEKMLTEAHSNVLTKDWFSTSRNILRIVETLSKYGNRARDVGFGEENLEVIKIDDIENMPNFKARFSQLKINSLWGHLKDECNNLISVIHPNSVSQPMIQQIVYEVQRFGFIINLFTYFSKAILNGDDFTPVEIDMINEIFENMNGSKEIDDNFEKEMSEKLQKLAQLHRVSNFGISQKERIEILIAVGKDIRHWYKCPNGHHYGIGQCGEAMEIAKCPECEAQIGGGFHRILDTNFDAQNEMYEGSGISANRYRNPFFARR